MAPLAQPPAAPQRPAGNSHAPLIIASVFAFLGVAAIALIAVLALGDKGDKGEQPVLTAAEQSTSAQPEVAAPAPAPETPSPAQVTVTATVTPTTGAQQGGAPAAPKAAPPARAPAPAAGPTPGTIMADGEMYAEIMSKTSLNIRTGPGTAYAKVLALRHGTAITITCWARGDLVTPGGGRTATDIWDYVTSPASGWVADAYVNTGAMSPAYNLPSC